MTFPTTHPALARALAAKDYATPTAVQLAVLAEEASGRDLLVSAQTGSGKTVAFGLAMATSLLAGAERFETAAEPLALIVAPTRELALQVQRELAWLYAETGARVVTCVGGMDGQAEARQLRFGAHIVVGTPGRLRDHLERSRLDLSKLKTAVLDEADEMLDLGFREDLEFILDATPAERQTLLFSATMPREIETLARRYQREALRIATVRRDEQHADIEYQAIRVAPFDIENAVVNVLRFYEVRASIVFCATREAVKRMHARLVERGFAAVALSGELTQNERTQALQSLRDGRARVLVATDVAARGLDLPDLALVIHAELPNDGETLLHRSGRTGRAGKKGLCVLIVGFNRRRKAEMLLNAARITARWVAAPTPEEIRARDQERFLADSVFTDAATEEEQAALAVIQANRTPEQIALALVRMRTAQLPAPEDLAKDTGPPPRVDRFGVDRYAARDSERSARWVRPDRGDRPVFADGAAPRRPRREDKRPMVWFRLNIGRDKNADPRWLLPLICNQGRITKAEIGTIRIQDRDTRFEILAEQADAFAEAVQNNKSKEGQISRVGAYTDADDDAVAKAIAAIPAAPRAAAADKPRKPRTWDKPKHDDGERPERKPTADLAATPDDAPVSAASASEGTADATPLKAKTRDKPRDFDKAKDFDKPRTYDKPKTWGDKPKSFDKSQSFDKTKSFDKPKTWDKPKPWEKSGERRDRKPEGEHRAHAPRSRDAHSASAAPAAAGGDRPQRSFERKPERSDRWDRGTKPGSAPGTGPRPYHGKSASGGEGHSSEGKKPAWRDRDKSAGAGAPGKKPWTPKPTGGGFAAKSDKPRPAQRYHGANQPGGKPTSKYAHKKRQRPPAAQ